LTRQMKTSIWFNIMYK